MTRSEAGKLGAIASRENQLDAKQKRIDKYLENPKLCRFCKKTIEYLKKENSFCNHSCASSFNNIGKRRHGNAKDLIGYENDKPVYKSLSNQECLNCNKIFKPENSSRKFCSQSCNHDYNWTNLKLQFESSGKFRAVRTTRRYLIEKHGNRCSICRITDWCGQKTPLVMDHINGNSDDWSITNCRMICPNCDAQTSTFKSKNKGNGRFLRRQRYTEGLSY